MTASKRGCEFGRNPRRAGPRRCTGTLFMRCWIISILLVLACASYVQCQQAGDSNKVSYEGQKVAAVDLVANPKISVESLRPLVQQKTGEGYSGSKVENTISALRGTGRFSKVEVEVKPDPGACASPSHWSRPFTSESSTSLAQPRDNKHTGESGIPYKYYSAALALAIQQ